MVNSGKPRSEIVLATKVNGTTGKGQNDRGSSRGHIMDAVKASLKRLGTDHIDLYQIHGQDMTTPVEETVRALEDLVRQGHVRYVASPTGRPGASRRRSALPTATAGRASPRSRRTTLSPAATSSATSSRCSSTRRSG